MSTGCQHWFVSVRAPRSAITSGSQASGVNARANAGLEFKPGKYFVEPTKRRVLRRLRTRNVMLNSSTNRNRTARERRFARETGLLDLGAR